MKDATRAVHAGETPDADGSVNQAVVASTTYRYPERADGSEAQYIYSRYDNPTLAAVEAKLATLEGSDRAFVFASGLGAEMAVFQAFSGPIAMQTGAYGGTAALVEDELVPHGIRLDRFTLDEPKFADDTAIVWVESITNPLLRVADIRALADAAHAVGAVLAVDATFASPALQRPLEHGADIVVHSGTKYLNGHSDVTAGVVCCSDDVAGRIWTHRRNLGATLDPMAAYMLGRGIKTLPLRMKTHVANAKALADAAREMGVTVHYPGLTDHPDHEITGRVLSEPGGMVALDLGSLEAAQAFRRAIRIMTPAASLGGVETLVSLPIETSHAYDNPEGRASEGITDGLVRISVGIEDIRDLLADLEQALEATRNL